MVYDKDGSLLHADIPDLAYREDSNHRRIHASQIEADDCFYGFGEKSGEINKAEKYMNMAPGDAMGYNAKETDSLYKHIPFYIRLNRGTKQAVGYFYHNTAECDSTWAARSATTGTATRPIAPTRATLTCF